MPALDMNTTFTKMMKQPAPVNGYLAIWQRGCGLFGSAGTKS